MPTRKMCTNLRPRSYSYRSVAFRQLVSRSALRTLKAKVSSKSRSANSSTSRTTSTFRVINNTVSANLTSDVHDHSVHTDDKGDISSGGTGDLGIRAHVSANKGKSLVKTTSSDSTVSLSLEPHPGPTLSNVQDITGAGSDVHEVMSVSDQCTPVCSPIISCPNKSNVLPQHILPSTPEDDDVMFVTATYVSIFPIKMLTCTVSIDSCAHRLLNK